MKIFRKLLSVTAFALLLLFASPQLASAQINPSDPACDPLDPGCPIDSGVTVLIAAGIGYGIKKIRDSQIREIA